MLLHLLLTLALSAISVTGIAVTPTLDTRPFRRRLSLVLLLHLLLILTLSAVSVNGFGVTPALDTRPVLPIVTGIAVTPTLDTLSVCHKRQWFAVTPALDTLPVRHRRQWFAVTPALILVLSFLASLELLLHLLWAFVLSALSVTEVAVTPILNHRPVRPYRLKRYRDRCYTYPWFSSCPPMA